MKEAAALEKLVMPLEIRKTVDSSMVKNRNPMKVPDNNPFKKMKCDEIQLDQIESMTEQVSVAIDVENFDVLCVTPYSSTPLEVLDKSSRKRRLSDICSDQTAEQVSGITEVEDPDILCINLESQESVNSKPIKATDGKRRGKTEKSMKSNSKSSENKKSSILNFFSRV